MKKCDESATKCPYAGTGYCRYYSGLEDFDPCPVQLHNWADLSYEFSVKEKAEETEDEKK